MPIEVPSVRILIVDDDKAICDFMQSLLEKDGFIVKTLSDPTLVEDEVRQGDYHVLILDLMMPKMDGIEVLKKIRTIDSDIAVVIFTAHPNLDSAVASMKLDAVDYIKKPFNVEEFREVLARVERLLDVVDRVESSPSISSLYKIAVALDSKIHDLFGNN